MTERAAAEPDAAAGSRWSEWRPGGPTGTDRLLALLVALGLPVAAAWLLAQTGGALAPLVLYFGVVSVALPLWRRGSLGYHRPVRWPWPVFLPALAIPFVQAALGLEGGWPGWPNGLGPWLTVLLWAPLNGALEHLGWFFVLDAWRAGWPDRRGRVGGLLVGAVLTLVLVGGIHALFWARVLPVGDGIAAVGIGLNTLALLAYVVLRDRSRSQWPVFVVHTAIDVQLVLVAGYSILPDL